MTASPEGLVEHLVGRCTFPTVDAVVCGVSGGPDSVALLVLACASGRTVTAVHVDHALREGSAHEAELVADVARRFGAEFVARTAAVAAGPNLEARARAARHSVLGDEALLGHTADDQAETVLLHLLRGTGPEGLCAMSSQRHPLLGLRRHETEALCAALDIEVFRDPTNVQRQHRRNRVRAEVLPLLDDIADRDVVPLLARTAELQRDALAVLDAAALGLDPCDVAALRAAPIGVARHAVRSWWRRETGVAYAPPAAAIERIMSVVRGEAVATEVVDGWRVARHAGRLRLEHAPSPRS